MRTLHLSSAATADLSEISAYSLATFGPDAARAYVRALDKVMDRLLYFPELGCLMPALAQRPRCVPCNRDRIFYRVEGETILVVRILHHKMSDAEWL